MEHGQPGCGCVQFSGFFFLKNDCCVSKRASLVVCPGEASPSRWQYGLRGVGSNFRPKGVLQDEYQGEFESSDCRGFWADCTVVTVVGGFVASCRLRNLHFGRSPQLNSSPYIDPSGLHWHPGKVRDKQTQLPLGQPQGSCTFRSRWRGRFSKKNVRDRLRGLSSAGW